MDERGKSLDKQFKIWNELTTFSRYLTVVFLTLFGLNIGLNEYLAFLFLSITFNLLCFNNMKVILYQTIEWRNEIDKLNN